MLEAGVDHVLLHNDASTALFDARGAATEALSDGFAAAYPGVQIASWEITVGRSGRSTTDPKPLDTTQGAYVLARASAQHPGTWIQAKEKGKVRRAPATGLRDALAGEPGHDLASHEKWTEVAPGQVAAITEGRGRWMTVIATPAATGPTTACGRTPATTQTRASPQELAAGLPPEAQEAAIAYLHYVFEAGAYAPKSCPSGRLWGQPEASRRLRHSCGSTAPA
jgi:hypothetical protein